MRVISVLLLRTQVETGRLRARRSSISARVSGITSGCRWTAIHCARASCDGRDGDAKKREAGEGGKGEWRSARQQTQANTGDNERVMLFLAMLF